MTLWDLEKDRQSTGCPNNLGTDNRTNGELWLSKNPRMDSSGGDVPSTQFWTQTRIKADVGNVKQMYVSRRLRLITQDLGFECFDLLYSTEAADFCWSCPDLSCPSVIHVLIKADCLFVYSHSYLALDTDDEEKLFNTRGDVGRMLTLCHVKSLK